MNRKVSFSAAVMFFIVVLAATTADGQLTYEFSAISYDDSNNTVNGYSATEIDYWSAYYYQAYVESYLWDDSTAQELDGGYDTEPDLAEVYTSASSSAQHLYEVDANHAVIAEYHYVEIHKSPEGCYPCDGCNDDCYYYYENWFWYDAFGFSSTNPGNYGPWGTLFGEGPDVYVEDQEYEPLGETSAALITSGCGCPTPVNDSEWGQNSSLWPNLVRTQTCKLASASDDYNCMAWTLGDTHHWIWDEADANSDHYLSVSEVTAFYESRGKHNIAYYGTGTDNVLHVARKGGGKGNDCPASSKLGHLMRMAHLLTQLEGGAYGSIVGGN